MPYLALIDEQEVEFPDLAAVAEALRTGLLSPESWIKDIHAEADWEALEEKLPDLCRGIGQ